MTISSASGEPGSGGVGDTAVENRMDWLNEHEIFETLAEDRFQNLTDLARKTLEIENAAIDVLDEAKQYVAVCSGPCNKSEPVPRDQSLCSITVSRNEMLVIEDVREAEFLDEPETYVERGVRSYAGVPLELSNGIILGSFCVFESRPRSFSDQALEGLAIFGEQTVNLVNEHLVSSQFEETVSLLDTTFEAVDEGLLLVDAERVLDYNERFLELWGLEPEFCRDCTRSELIQKLQSRVLEPEEFTGDLFDRGACPGAGENEIRLKIEGDKYLELSVNRRRSANLVVGLVVSFREVTDEVEANEELSLRARRDPLTGLLNRDEFTTRLEDRISRINTGQRVGILAFNVKNFDRINNSLGHAAGDRALNQVAGRFANADVGDSLIGRLAGDKFLLATPPLGPEGDLQSYVDPVLASFEAPISVCDTEFRVDLSIGGAIFPDTVESRERLIPAALAALQRQRSRESVNELNLFFDPIEDEEITLIDLEKDFRQALDQGGFELYYQPQVNLNSSSSRIFEALIRWNYPGRGQLSPLYILRLASTTATTYELDLFVARTVCEFQQELAGQYPDLKFAVNVSASTLVRGAEFVEDLEAVQASTGTPPDKLILEITEETLVDNTDEALEVVNHLHELGYTIAIDDFGTGYSSLGFLADMDFDILKIDRKFVHDLVENRRQRVLLNSIVETAHNLDMEVVGEGAETADEVDFLASVGCDFIQGFYYSKPLPEPRFREYLTEQ